MREFGGVPVPAHINRGSNGLLVNLGFMPEDLTSHGGGLAAAALRRRRRWRGRQVLHSSDAHYLGDIQERENALRLEHRTASRSVGLDAVQKEDLTNFLFKSIKNICFIDKKGLKNACNFRINVDTIYRYVCIKDA